MGIFTPREQRNTEHLKFKNSASTPEKAGEGKIKPFLLKNSPEKVLEQSQSAVERD